MPQMNRIETGRVVTRGSFSGVLSGSYSLKKPDIMQVSDSSFESRSSWLGDEFTIITSSNGYCYESRLMVSGEGIYGFSDVISAGVSLEASLGKLTSAPSNCGLTIKNNDIEVGMDLWWCRLSVQSLCSKPIYYRSPGIIHDPLQITCFCRVATLGYFETE
jgi:hypothetical protein